MAPSLSPDTQSPPSSCGSDDERQEKLEFLGVADTALNDDNWGWLRDLLDRVHDAAVGSQAKVFFARLFKAQDAAEVDATLSEMESWRNSLGGDEERKLARALFLLGYDKNMSLGQ
ncbi:uncharacterized protein PITG_20056 [Phytophthora infestans T30-4]|uniref:Uncharacterized protein n=1 Tax=Phytophthora infestans (strain T30-4) TaxID=403677 RepID=D0P1K4_PHYIT|nr:uncharacterized protein PITG_20056 [Phytophthora infestans T30-4]EEY54629.1 conserved hypothetical protein [Phytophthora infestans T30-4]|eukprot:XP_002895827.1 conserved hypothetical protein [Phytophthora infestans T30-4]